MLQNAQVLRKIEKSVDKYPGGVYSINRPPGGIKEKIMSEKKKMRTEDEKKLLIRRLKLAEGQIRGIQKMVEEDAYCPDILIQVSAVTSALNSFNKELLACHVKSCVSEDIRKGNDEAIDEFVKVLQKLMK